MIPSESILWAYAFAASALFPPAPLFDGTGGTATLASAAPDARTHAHTTPFGIPTPRSGALASTYSADLYHRLHIAPLKIDAGNVIGEQQHSVRVWNAYLYGRALEAIHFLDAEGITLAGGSVPASLPPLSEPAWTVRITQAGPPVVAATLVFDFDGGDAYAMPVTGSRVTAWVWLPDWSEPFLERYVWMTDVLQAHDGAERRRALRLGPRRQVEWSCAVEGSSRRRLENTAHGWGARVWARPDVARGAQLTATAPAGSTALAFATDYMGLSAGDMIMLHDGAQRAEIATVAAVSAGGVVLERPTVGAWSAGSRIYRALASRLDGPLTLTHESDTISRLRVDFADLAPADWPADHGLASYRGAPVLTLRHDWSEQPAHTLHRKLDLIDHEVGGIYWDDESGHPEPVRVREYLLHGRAAIDAFQRLLCALRGRQGVAWIDSGVTDYLAAAPMPGVGVALDIEWSGYALYVAAARGRRDLRIDTTAGVFHRRVIAAEELSGSIERLTLDAPLGVNLNANDFRRISILTPCRLDADAVELAWITDSLARCRIAWRSVPDEL